MIPQINVEFFLGLAQPLFTCCLIKQGPGQKSNHSVSGQHRPCPLQNVFIHFEWGPLGHKSLQPKKPLSQNPETHSSETWPSWPFKKVRNNHFSTRIHRGKRVPRNLAQQQPSSMPGHCDGCRTRSFCIISAASGGTKVGTCPEESENGLEARGFPFVLNKNNESQDFKSPNHFLAYLGCSNMENIRT